MELEFNPVANRKSYSIELSLDDFTALCDYDWARIWHEDGDSFPSFDKALYDQNCIDVEYNGHFGQYIYFQLDVADDTPERWKAIEEIFEYYIKYAREWLEENKE